jgi:predicted amidophosphoribosyltransferase
MGSIVYDGNNCIGCNLLSDFPNKCCGCKNLLSQVELVALCEERAREIKELIQQTNNSQIVKLPCLMEVNRRVNHWLYNGYVFCPYCGRQLHN